MSERQEEQPEYPLATLLGGQEGHEIRNNGDYQALTYSSGGERKYHENQDSAYANAEKGAIAVIDGMGGHGGGREASLQATTAINDGIIEGVATDEIFKEAKERIQRVPGDNPGVTLAIVRTIQSQGKYYVECTNIGDAKVIITHPQKGLIYASKDQSRVQSAYDTGHLQDPLERYTNAENNIVLNGIMKGIDLKAPERQIIEVEQGTYALTLSDGITDFVSTEEIVEIVQKHGKSAPVKIKELAESRQWQVNGFYIKLNGHIMYAFSENTNAGDNIAIAMMIVGGENSNIGATKQHKIQSPNKRLHIQQLKANTENIYQNIGTLGIQFGIDANLYISLIISNGHLELHLNIVDGKVVYLNPGEEIILGRDDLGGDQRISRQHIKIKYLQNNSISITDLGSSNGTRVFR